MYCVYEREIRGEFILKNVAKIALPKSVANELDNVSPPNGIVKIRSYSHSYLALQELILRIR